MLEHYSQPCYINAEHPCLVGHFPTNPIVPGVVILDEVLRAAQQSADLGSNALDSFTLNTVKFLAPLRPEQHFIIQLELNRSTQRIAFQCLRDTQLIAKGILQLDNL